MKLSKKLEVTSEDNFDLTKIVERIVLLTRTPEEFSGVISGSVLIKILMECRAN